MSEYICPNCKNPIYDDEALLCHFCGESLNRSGKGFISNLRYSNNSIIWTILAVVAVVAFIFLILF